LINSNASLFIVGLVWGFGETTKTAPELSSNRGGPQRARGWSGNDVNIQPARQNVSVQSKIVANNSLNLVSGYGLPDLFIDGYSKARSLPLVALGNDNEIVAVSTLPIY
jgi:hypothetical protein